MNEPTDPIRLGDDALTALAARGVEVPGFDRSTLVPRIVHIGVGGFHRAHLAVRFIERKRAEHEALKAELEELREEFGGVSDL